MSPLALNVFDELNRMRGEMDRLLGAERSPRWGFPFSRVSFLPGRAARSYPLMNISEDADNVYVDALAPGIDPESIEISMTGDQLSISGEKMPLQDNIAAEMIHRNERASGRFLRSVTLPSEVENDKVEARYKDGLLRITLPKAEQAKPKKIQVSVS
jgi:HSP20 family protein